jgi:glycosyltransferase involved in cell wall biosynthesis
MLHQTHIAFYAPIKPPDHPIPSGDRLIAQNLLKAFRICGADVKLASSYIAYSKRHAVEILQERKQGAIVEAERLLAEYNKMNPKDLPQAWVTYHPYCKAPDWIGPIVTAALEIPYITIEAARTGQGGSEDLWAPWRAQAQEGIKKADMHLVFKPTDHAYLQELLGYDETLVSIKPFIDAENMKLEEPFELPESWSNKTPVLVTTGMMRKGKKLENFKILSETLGKVVADFNLIIIGGGPEEASVRQYFSEISPKQVHWTGQIEHRDVLRWMRSADFFVWPGWKEPIGMVYLEAQLQELPVVAYKSMGVPLVVENGKSGLLSKEDDTSLLAENITALIADADRCKEMGKAGRTTVLEQHGIKAAAKRLDETISRLL